MVEPLIIEAKLGGNTLTLNMRELSFSLNRKPVVFSDTEFRILYTLFWHAGEVVDRECIARAIWHDGYRPVLRTVDVHVCRVRKKIGKDWIKKQQGVGYMLNLTALAT